MACTVEGAREAVQSVRCTLLFVDAIQALGVIPFDVEELNIDALACGAHKWLMGIEGTGFVYLSPQLGSNKSIVFEAGSATRMGWTFCLMVPAIFTTNEASNQRPLG